MLTQLILGCVMIGITVIIHAVALDRLVLLLKRMSKNSPPAFHSTRRIAMMVTTVLGVFLTHIVQIWLWAILFYLLEPNILANFEMALYFSTSSFTTVGFGDVFLDENWRLLSSFEAANGFILFGWSTAFIFEIILKLYKNDKIK